MPFPDHIERVLIAYKLPDGEPVVVNEIERRIDAMHRYLTKTDAAPQPDRWKLHKARTVIGWFSKGNPAREGHPHRVAGHRRGVGCAAEAA